MGKLRSLGHIPLVGLVCLALTPAVFALGSRVEATMFPVVRNTQITHAEETRDGIRFFVDFDKVRQCKFLGLVWYEGPVRLTVDFEPHSEDAPRARPTGRQHVGPWLVQGLRNLSGSRAVAFHRCHPLWLTITTFYEG